MSFGYIEKAELNGKILLYNSAAVVDRSGKTILNYRKCHLYFNDKLWATEGEKFAHFELVTT